MIMPEENNFGTCGSLIYVAVGQFKIFRMSGFECARSQNGLNDVRQSDLLAIHPLSFMDLISGTTCWIVFHTHLGS